MNQDPGRSLADRLSPFQCSGPFRRLHAATAENLCRQFLERDLFSWLSRGSLDLIARATRQTWRDP